MKKITFKLGMSIWLLLSCCCVFGQAQFQTTLHFGSGFDLSEGSNPNNYTSTLSESQFEIDLRNPITARLGLGVQFKRIGIHTGFMASKRNLKIHYLESGDKEKADIKYAVFSLPLDVNYLQPLTEKLSLNMGLGLGIDWSGDDDAFRFSGWVPEAEEDGRWQLFNSNNAEIPNRLLLVTDEGFLNIITFKPFVGLQYQLNDKMFLSFNTTYRTNIEKGSAISGIYVWGYDAEQNVRNGGYSPRRLDYKTLNFDIGFIYSL